MEREPLETEENEETDSHELCFEEEKPSALHLRAETREPNDAISSPYDFSHKRRRSFSSLRSQSASPDVTGMPGILNSIKTESKSEFPECSLSEQTENTITDTHLHLPYHPVHVNLSHISRDSSTPPRAHVRAENMMDAAGPFGVTVRRENSHTCHVCGKSFATASSLGAHFVCHSGERPFACERCKFRFSRLADLKKHERIHTGEKPYNCTLCGRRFNRTENLRRHLRKVHHGALL
ncbi:hypothetical protein PHYPO_G00040850 [Pangasianodon hypophthalmus]|uniref:C2H2-type domain-containing protein n=1 Tax=Pangasianodon hypophthalmus TaxID=310915 RepID=A0A5N5MH92_PANHP|nr:hypothetical protein PHYPO_G00040850 [Pangasianodon hypophthalmus]